MVRLNTWSHSFTYHPAEFTFQPLPHPIKAGTRCIDPENMKGWVGLVSGRFTHSSGHPSLSGRSSAGQGKFAGRRPTFYHCAMQPTSEPCLLLPSPSPAAAQHHRRLAGIRFNVLLRKGGWVGLWVQSSDSSPLMWCLCWQYILRTTSRSPTSVLPSSSAATSRSSRRAAK